MLQNGEQFPSLSFSFAGGGKIELPGDLAGAFGVILFYRGFWSHACNDQLYAFARAADAFAEEGIKVVAVSVDDRKSTEALVERMKLSFPVAYAADARAVSAVTGAIVNEDAVFLEATGFVLNPEGRIEAAVYTSDESAEDRIVTIAYSSGVVGRLMPDDVLRLVRNLKSAR
jgi:peroxiredoxin